MSTERKKEHFYEQEQGMMEEQDFSELSVTLPVPEIFVWVLEGEVVLLVSACTVHTFFCRSCV